MRKQGKDVSVEVICNGLIALQGNHQLLVKAELLLLLMIKKFEQDILLSGDAEERGMAKQRILPYPVFDQWTCLDL